MKFPDFSFEKPLWQKGFVVIGVDEVGRGAWAGSVVVAAVAFGIKKRFRHLPHATKDARQPLEEFLKKFSSSLSERRPPETKDSMEERDGSAFNSFVGGQPPRALCHFIENLGINDSKALGSQKREQLAEIIKECSIWSVAEVGVGTINRVGIGKATEMAMRKTLHHFIPHGKLIKRSDLGRRPRRGRTSVGKVFVLVDAFHIRYLQGVGLKNQKAIIKGDQKSISIAAASILAKVYRDRLMRKLAKKHPQYGWGRSKGYGTREHQEAILNYGITRLHRKRFVETFLRKIGETK